MELRKRNIEHQVKAAIEQRPVAHTNFSLSDPRDRRAIIFWLIELASMISFILWLAVATYVGGIYFSLNFPNAGRTWPGMSGEKSSNSSIRENSLKQVSVDVWFALSLTVAMDALAVVFTFNRALIRKFHYVVSQRLMFLASIISYGIFWLAEERRDFLSLRLIECLAVGMTLYSLLGYALDTFENDMPSHNSASRFGTLAQYGKGLGKSETTWLRSLFLASVVGGVGLILTMLIPPPWSVLVPVGHIAFESIFLSMMNSQRTSRYLTLCSPVFFATICVHWGVTPLLSDSRLCIRPSFFMVLLIIGRLLVDAHLWTTLRTRSELQWARKNAVLSTPSLIILCIIMTLLEFMGLKVITYIKPLAVILFFGLGSAGFLAIAAYDVAARIPAL